MARISDLFVLELPGPWDSLGLAQVIPTSWCRSVQEVKTLEWEKKKDRDPPNIVGALAAVWNTQLETQT